MSEELTKAELQAAHDKWNNERGKLYGDGLDEGYKNGYKQAISDVLCKIACLVKERNAMHQIEQADFNIADRIIAAISSEEFC